jgi:hypothetical protein
MPRGRQAVSMSRMIQSLAELRSILLSRSVLIAALSGLMRCPPCRLPSCFRTETVRQHQEIHGNLGYTGYKTV